MASQNSRLNRHGLTLIELLVTVALIAIFFGVITSVSFGIQKTTFQSRALAEQQSDMRFVMDRIARLVRLGYAVQPITGGYLVKYPPGVYPGAVYDDTGKFYFEKFGLYTDAGASDNNKVWIRDNSFPLCGYIESLALTVSGNEVTITLVSKDQIPGVRRGLPITLVTKVQFRNKGTP